MLLALDENNLGTEDESVCLDLPKLFIDRKAILIILAKDSRARIGAAVQARVLWRNVSNADAGAGNGSRCAS